MSCDSHCLQSWAVFEIIKMLPWKRKTPEDRGKSHCSLLLTHKIKKHRKKAEEIYVTRLKRLKSKVLILSVHIQLLWNQVCVVCFFKWFKQGQIFLGKTNKTLIWYFLSQTQRNTTTNPFYIEKNYFLLFSNSIFLIVFSLSHTAHNIHSCYCFSEGKTLNKNVIKKELSKNPDVNTCRACFYYL